MNAPIPALPTTRPAGCPFDPPKELTELREHRPLARMVYPDGHVGWLVTSHELVRAVLADTRFSSRYELMHYPLPGGPEEMPPAPMGDMTGMDAPEHTRYRQLLAGHFTVRRMRLLTSGSSRCVRTGWTPWRSRARPRTWSPRSHSRCPR